MNLAKHALRNCFVKGETPLERYIFGWGATPKWPTIPYYVRLRRNFRAYRGFAKQFLRKVLLVGLSNGPSAHCLAVLLHPPIA